LSEPEIFFELGSLSIPEIVFIVLEVGDKYIVRLISGLHLFSKCLLDFHELSLHLFAYLLDHVSIFEQVFFDEVLDLLRRFYKIGRMGRVQVFECLDEVLVV